MSEQKNSVGSLLADYSEMSRKGSACAIQHNGLVDYLVGVMKKLGIDPSAK